MKEDNKAIAYGLSKELQKKHNQNQDHCHMVDAREFENADIAHIYKYKKQEKKKEEIRTRKKIKEDN